MSVKAMSWVWEHSRAKGSARMVLLALADHAGQEDGDSWPSVGRLARRCGLGERTVQQAITTLVDLGELEVQWRCGPRGANRYRLTLTPAESAPPQISHPAESASRPPQNLRETPQISHLTPAESAPEPSLTVSEPSVNRHSCAVDRFDEFWQAYPRAVAKGAAKKAWAKATRDADPDDIIDGARRYAAERAGQDDRYTAHASTWLNAERWLDDPTPRHKPQPAGFASIEASLAGRNP
jgi:hypothetical protein